MKPREDEGGRTVDVMRFVLTYGLHRLNDSPDNEPFTNKRFEEAIRSLIRDMVKYSKEKLDFYTSKRAPSVQRNTKNRCEFHERLETSGDNWDHVELQRGDWLCKRYTNFCNS